MDPKGLLSAGYVARLLSGDLNSGTTVAGEAIKVHRWWLPLPVRLAVSFRDPWTRDEVDQQLNAAYSVYRKHGVLLWWPSVTIETEAPEVLRTVAEGDRILENRFNPPQGDRKTVPVIFIRSLENPTNVEGFALRPPAGRGAFIFRHWHNMLRYRGFYIPGDTWNSRRLTTAHELGHAIGNIGHYTERFPNPGYLMGDPTDSVLRDSERRRIRSGAWSLR